MAYALFTLKNTAKNIKMLAAEVVISSLMDCIFSRQHIEIFVLFFTENGFEYFMQSRQYEWKVKSCFLRKIRKNKYLNGLLN